MSNDGVNRIGLDELDMISSGASYNITVGDETYELEIEDITDAMSENQDSGAHYPNAKSYQGGLKSAKKK